MQRVLSVETSRSGGWTSEFVTKRLCCSFLLTVTFFAVIGGFFLGRFATEKSIQKLKVEVIETSKKILILDKHLQETFRESSRNCTDGLKLNCSHLKIVVQDTSLKSLEELLGALNDCFNYG